MQKRKIITFYTFCFQEYQRSCLVVRISILNACCFLWKHKQGISVANANARFSFPVSVILLFQRLQRGVLKLKSLRYFMKPIRSERVVCQFYMINTKLTVFAICLAYDSIYFVICMCEMSYFVYLIVVLLSKVNLSFLDPP